MDTVPRFTLRVVQSSGDRAAVAAGGSVRRPAPAPLADLTLIASGGVSDDAPESV